MAVSAKDVAALRQRTGLGMMECKKALTEADGDQDKAVEILREMVGGKMDERSGREAAEGVVAAARRGDSVAMVEMRSETDFVARNEDFVSGANKIAEMLLDGEDGLLAAPTPPIKAVVDDLRLTTRENVSMGRGAKISGEKVGFYVHHNRSLGVIIAAEGDFTDDLMVGICQHIAAVEPTPMAIDEEGLSEELVAKQREEAVAEAEATGKPKEIAEKIAVGKLRKWVDENTLMGQMYLREMDSKKAVREFVPKGAKILKFVRFRLGEA